jgi:hypothetical protein
MNLNERCESLVEKYSKVLDDVSLERVTTEAKAYTDEWDVSPDGAMRMVEASLVYRHNIAHLEYPIDDVEYHTAADFETISLSGQTDLYLKSVWSVDTDSTTEDEQYVGIGADITGWVKIVGGDKIADMAEGHVNHFTSLKTARFEKGMPVLEPTLTTAVIPFSDHTPRLETDYIEGQITRIKPNSGYVRLCESDSACRQIIRPQSHECPTHGETYEYTNAYHTVVDIETGDEKCRVELATDTISSIIGIPPDKATETDTIGRDDIFQMLKDQLEGGYVFATVAHDDKSQTLTDYPICKALELNPIANQGRRSVELDTARTFTQTQITK